MRRKLLITAALLAGLAVVPILYGLVILYGGIADDELTECGEQDFDDDLLRDAATFRWIDDDMGTRS